jgi:putative nucleotidyltransferase with HDIG domain
MIKQALATASRLKIFFGIAATFLISYALEMNLSVPLFLTIVFVYLRLTQKKYHSQAYSLLNITFLFVLAFAASYFIISKDLSKIYIPYVLIPIFMLAGLLFNRLDLSLLLTLTLSLSIGALLNDVYFALLLFVGGIVSSIQVLGSRKRSQIIQAGLLIGIAEAIMLFFIESFKINGNVELYLKAVSWGAVSGFIVLAILPVFEYLFKTVTNISLLELADFNNPLLQRMILEAPGTYHHSLIVGNLSEAACNAIGANALLARIGAYYHDIGKLQKPDYFSENQMNGSKHDDLSPTMSKMVIINHVKDGIEMAKKYRFNPRLIDFIERHHGNSLVYFFYRRALEKVEDEQVKEDGFRYTGPRPNTKETAIVMLADTVEAAVRSIKEHTPTKITEATHKVINNKFIDGQLDECELTLKDLEKIANIFIRILSGIYHSRVTYPEGSPPGK